MGWTVLYIAFGIVALWLLGEVLLQYKARLRWRLLAFGGFLGVVVGVLIPSVVVIGLGAAAFAIGQTYVTLSFRRGFAEGWAVNAPGLAAVKGRRDDREEPALEVSGLEASEGSEAAYPDESADRRQDDSYGQDDDYGRDDVFTPAARPSAAETTTVYEPQPMPDDTGSYGTYGDTGGYTVPSQDPYQDQYATAAQGYSYDYSGYGQQQGYDTTGQQQYAAYSDPYIGNATYGGTSYDTGYTEAQHYDQQTYGQDGYAAGYGGETPAGGLWVPQQRTDDTYGGELPAEQSYPYQGDQQVPGNGAGNGYDEQYRY
ncbi:hypothetical protein [Streptomyces sp. enrichment culture]|uniref:SCO2102 family sporulation regulator n=1 Tax=Streptomyces sp. enrichment culture TaxID=1795815 RepID=UPI003F577126